MSEPDTPRAGARAAFAAAAVAVVALAALGGTLANGFVWDDRFLLLQDPSIRSLREVPGIFSRSLWWFTARPVAIDYYRPLQTLSFALEHALWGTRAAGYHAVNLALHLAASLLVLAIARRLLRRETPAVLAALLFAAHPIHVEAVAFVSNRGDLLASVLSLAGLRLLFDARHGDRAGAGAARLAAAVALYAAALLCKETALAFLPVLIAAALLRPGREALPDRATLRAGLAPSLALVACAAGFWQVRLAVLAGIPGGTVRFSPELSLTPRLLAKYLALIAFPHPLNASPDLARGGLALDGAQAAGLGLLLALLAAALALTARRAAVLFGLGWFLVTLSPVLRLVSGNITFAERYAYLPSAGLLLAACAAAAGLSERMPITPAARKALAAAGAALALSLAAAAGARTRVWRDEESLWRNTALRSPARYSVASHLAEALWERSGEAAAFPFIAGFFDARLAEGLPASAAGFGGPDGAAEAREAALLTARYLDLLLARGLAREARPWQGFLEGIDPVSFETFFYRGTLDLQLGRHRDAIASLSRALALEPGDAQALFNRGLAHEGAGETDLALRDYREIPAASPLRPAAAARLAALAGRRP